MLAKDVKLNIIPFGHRGVDKKPGKGEKNPLESWREYQNRLCPRKLGRTDNAALICGKVPGENYQVIVLDFDGQFGATAYRDIVMILEEHDLEKFYMVSWTGNRGFHFVYITDIEVLINNKQKKTLKEGIFPRQVKKIDVRGNGGLIYFPPTRFSDSAQEYKIIYQYPLNDIA